MLEPGPLIGNPSPHARRLAGTDLVAIPPTVVRAEEAREIVVVTSRSRDPGREIHLQRCREDGVPVVVRPTGGGSVVLAPGVVAASVLRPADPGRHLPEPYFRAFCGLVAGALAALGVADVSQRGTSDLCVGDRKVAGSSLRLWGDRVLFQVSVLVAMEVGLMDRYLAMPSREPEYRRGRPHREFVTTLQEAGFGATPEEVAARLEVALSDR